MARIIVTETLTVDILAQRIQQRIGIFVVANCVRSIRERFPNTLAVLRKGRHRERGNHREELGPAINTLILPLMIIQKRIVVSPSSSTFSDLFARDAWVFLPTL